MSDTIDTTEQIIEDDPIAVRRAKREALMAAGKDPYGHAFAYSHHLADLAEQYADLEDGASTEDEVKVAGRVMAKRDQGKLASSSCATPRATCSCSAASTRWARTRSPSSRTWTWATGSASRAR